MYLSFFLKTNNIFQTTYWKVFFKNIFRLYLYVLIWNIFFINLVTPLLLFWIQVKIFYFNQLSNCIVQHKKLLSKIVFVFSKLYLKISIFL